MARKRDRAFAGFFAGLFLLTSSALTIGVIYQLVQNSHGSTPTNASTQSTKPKGTQVDSTKLQGKPLAGFTPMSSIPKLQEIDTTPGTGAVVQPGATVTVDYTGAVASTGLVFQSSKDSSQAVPPLSLKSGSVIEGWVQGIPGMKVGGTRRLLIPASLAYGASPPQGSGIPANADLVFDVTLHSIGK